MGPGKPFEVGAQYLGGGNVAQPCWAMKKIFHFLNPQNALKRYAIGEKNNFYGLI